MDQEIINSSLGDVNVFNEFRSSLSKLKIDNQAAVFDYESIKGNKEARSHIYKLRQTKSAVEKSRKIAMEG